MQDLSLLLVNPRVRQRLPQSVAAEPETATDQLAEPSSSVRLLTVEQVGRLLAVSTRQVWRLASAGAIPQPVRIGRRVVRWRLIDLESFIQAL